MVRLQLPSELLRGPAGQLSASRSRERRSAKAVRILHARQFNAGNVQDVLQTVKAGHLNNGMAAYDRVFDGLASSDLLVVSISDGLSDGHAHCLLPSAARRSRRASATCTCGTPCDRTRCSRVLRQQIQPIRITGPTDWTTTEPDPPTTSSTLYEGARHGGCSPSRRPAVRNEVSPSASATRCRTSRISCCPARRRSRRSGGEGRPCRDVAAAGRPAANWRQARGRTMAVGGRTGCGKELYLVACADTASHPRRGQ